MIKDRVLEVLDFKGIPKEYFFKKIGASSANFRGPAKKTTLSSTTIKNIISEIPDINIEWLITGKGEMLKPLNLADAEDFEMPEPRDTDIGGNLSDRVRAVLLHFQLNPQNVGNITGKASNTFRNIINGKTNDIRISTIVSILKMVPSVDARWLLTGAGKMIISHKTYRQGPEYNIAAEPEHAYRCQACSNKDGEIKTLKQYNQMLSDKSDRQQEEIGKLRQQLEELKGRGNNRNSKQAV